MQGAINPRKFVTCGRIFQHQQNNLECQVEGFPQALTILTAEEQMMKDAGAIYSLFLQISYNHFLISTENII